MDHAERRWIPKRSATPSTALVPQRKVGFPIPNAGLLLGFQGTKTARREGISSPFSDAGGCTSRQNSGPPQRCHVKETTLPSGCQENVGFSERGSTPVRLAHTPTRCRVVPVARIKLGIGRRLCVASDA